MVVVNTLHMVLEIPLAGESVARYAALASFILAEERLVTVPVEAMGLALMTEKAGSRGEPGTLASLSLAAVRLQMRVHKFADRVSCYPSTEDHASVSTYS